MKPEEVFLSFVAMAGTAWLLSPLARALAERIRPHAPAIDAGADAFRDEVLQELQHVRRELVELSDRVDFTERLLAKVRDGDRLAPPPPQR